MLKDIFGFLAWKWRNTDTWQKVWFLAMFIFGMGLGADEPYSEYLMTLGVAILVLLLIVGLIWPSIKQSWDRYIKEKYELFKTIKESDGA